MTIEDMLEGVDDERPVDFVDDDLGVMDDIYQRKHDGDSFREIHVDLTARGEVCQSTGQPWTLALIKQAFLTYAQLQYAADEMMAEEDDSDDEDAVEPVAEANNAIVAAKATLPRIRYPGGKAVRHGYPEFRP